MVKKKQVAFITGITGFIGSHLAERLLKLGWDVHGLVRTKTLSTKLRGRLKGTTFHRYDGTTASVQKAVSAGKPSVVFHLASLFLFGHGPQDIESLIQSNVLLGTQLAEAMKEGGVKCLINTGTSWQHFLNRDYLPVNLYAATKQAFEDILGYYVSAKALSVIHLKLFDTYGPNDERPKLFSVLRKAGHTGMPLQMSPGQQLIDLVYVEDVVEAFLTAAQRLQKMRVGASCSYAISSQKPLKLKHLIAVVEKVWGRKLPVSWGKRPYRFREVMKPWNCGKILPGWKPKVSLEQGLARLIGSW